MFKENTYHCLKRQTYHIGEYSIVPIRLEDRYSIMDWRNDQLYHLRQKKELTPYDQDIYFRTVVTKLFDDINPDQILFSYLKNKDCIGYGGLVHINWEDNIAELSFLIDTEIEKSEFELHWEIFLKLIEQVAFKELGFHKIFTYAFDLRPKLYPALEESGFTREARLIKHMYWCNEYHDIVVHAKFSKSLMLRNARFNDCEILYQWANNPIIRNNSFNKENINYDDHKNWLIEKLEDHNCLFYILSIKGIPVGSIRFDIDNHHEATINYLIDPRHQKKGYGKKILKLGIEKAAEEYDIYSFIGFVKKDNIASNKIFEWLKFHRTTFEEGVYRFEKKLS